MLNFAYREKPVNQAKVGEEKPEGSHPAGNSPRACLSFNCYETAQRFRVKHNKGVLREPADYFLLPMVRAA